MAARADSNRNLRQQCIDVLCGHMRLPYNPSAADHSEMTTAATHRKYSTTETDTYTFHQVPGEREVRFTIIRVIRDHLQPDADTSWRGYDFDLSGAVFDGGDFSGAQFTDGNFSFRKANFRSGNMSFVAAKLSGRNVDFQGAMFAHGSVNFLRRSLSVNESNSPMRISLVERSNLWGPSFPRGYCFGIRTSLVLKFGSIKRSSLPGGGGVSFGNATFSDGSIVFNSLFFGGYVSFFGAKFIGGNIDFQAAIISGGHVDFEEASFTGTDMRLNEIASWGGQIIFTKVREWKVPPKLPDPLPEDIHLPAHLNAQQ